MAKMLNRLFVREENEIEYTLKKTRIKVGVMGNAPMAGTSFVATAIASEISAMKGRRVAYVEIKEEERKPLLFDSLGMDKRFAGRTFHDFYEEARLGKRISGLLNLDERINWALNIPDSIKDRDTGHTQDAALLSGIINNIAADVVVCDITYGMETEKIMSEMDIIIFIIDPLPSKLLCGYDVICRIKKYQNEGGNVVWLLNKYNNGISRKELEDFLRQKEDFKLPVLPAEDIYSAEYNCRIPYSMKQIKGEIKNTISGIAHRIITIM